MALDCWNSVHCDLWVRICILVVWKLVNQKVNVFLQKKHEKKVTWVNWSQYWTHTKWTSRDFHRLGFRHEPIPVHHGPRQTWQQEKFKNVFAWVTTNLFHGPGTFCNRPYLRLGKTTHFVKSQKIIMEHAQESLLYPIIWNEVPFTSSLVVQTWNFQG